MKSLEANILQECKYILSFFFTQKKTQNGKQTNLWLQTCRFVFVFVLFLYLLLYLCCCWCQHGHTTPVLANPFSAQNVCLSNGFADTWAVASLAHAHVQEECQWTTTRRWQINKHFEVRRGLLKQRSCRPMDSLHHHALHTQPHVHSQISTKGWQTNKHFEVRKRHNKTMGRQINI